MSAVVIALEVVGITGAAVGIALAQNPPQDLFGWWERQDWLQWLVTQAVDPAEDEGRGLGILPWDPEEPPAADAGQA